MSGNKRKPSGKVFDISSVGIRTQIEEIRERGGGAREIQQLKRDLGPEIKRAYGKFRDGWERGSAGRRLRLAFASENPYLQRDVERAREVLDMKSVGDIVTPELKAWFKWNSAELRKSSEILDSDIGEPSDREIELMAIDLWLASHELAVAGREDLIPESLPARFAKSAKTIAAVRLVSDRVSKTWLKGIYQGPGESALHAVARRLTTRYGLHEMATTGLIKYLLTGDPEMVRIERVPDVDLTFHQFEHVSTGSLELKIVVDPYWSKSDWDAVWDGDVAPFIENVRKVRANLGFDVIQPDLKRLEKALPLIQARVRSGREQMKIGASEIGEYMELLALSERQVRRNLKDLELILQPTGNDAG